MVPGRPSRTHQGGEVGEAPVLLCGRISVGGQLLQGHEAGACLARSGNVNEAGVSEPEKQHVVGDVAREESWCQITKDLVKPDKDFRFSSRWESLDCGGGGGGSRKWSDLVYV